MFLLQFIKQHKFWLILFGLFLLLRIVVLTTFWHASQVLGGWEHFIGHAEPARFVLQGLFHEYCDWHPPLYYTFTSLILFIFRTPWAIVFAQILLAFTSVIFSWRIARLVLSERAAKIIAAMVALEPVWAWYNLLFVSGNLLAPFMLLGLFYLLRSIKMNRIKDLYFAAVWFGLGVLVRPNILMISIAISFILLVFYALAKKYSMNSEFLRVNCKRFFYVILFFNLVFFAVIAPWVIRNKLVYGRFTLANIMSTNIFQYNLPAAIAFRDKIPHETAHAALNEGADRDLGPNIGDRSDCHQFSKESLNRQLDYYEAESKKYIMANLGSYTFMHLFKTIPYFLTPGSYSMWGWYTNVYAKPDMTGSVLQGNFGAIFDFLRDVNLRLGVYLFEVLFWGVCSLSIFLSCVYAYFRDRKNFVFFVVAAMIVIYNALVVSPFVEARYRMPVYVLFFVPMVYMIAKLFFTKKHEE